jgi:hypothetical protein
MASKSGPPTREVLHNGHSIGLMNSYDAVMATLATSPRPKRPTVYCIGCSLSKPETDYYPSDLRIRIKRCKKCRNRAQRERWMACKNLVDQLKDIDCPDCGLRWPRMCMEFDHIDPANKDIALSKIIASGSMRRLKAELAKGQFLCSNCHRIRTGGFRYRAKPPKESLIARGVKP